jgi:hypothetical protein
MKKKLHTLKEMGNKMRRLVFLGLDPQGKLELQKKINKL